MARERQMRRGIVPGRGMRIQERERDDTQILARKGEL